jgi:hypothetical protein
MSPRPFPEGLFEIEYGPDDFVRKVDLDGFISFKNVPIRIGKGLRRQHIALRPTATDGVFSVHFCIQRIGTVDLRDTASPSCGFVDIAFQRGVGGEAADAMPTTPQVQQQQNSPETRI